MKRNFFRGLVVSLFVLGLCAVARSQEPDRLVVNIPCDFVVNGKSLPSGKYKVQRYDRDMRLLVLIDAERSTSIVTLSGQVLEASTAHPGVTLEKAGEQRFLTQIQTAEHIFVLPKSGTPKAVDPAI